VLRPAVPADAESLALMHLAAWRQTYGGLLSEAFLDGLAVGPRLDFWHRVLADPVIRTWLLQDAVGAGGGVFGFASTRPGGTDGPRELELWGIYLLADRQGRRLGQRLWHAAVGERPCFLWVAEQNLAAQEFYRRNGMTPDGARQSTAWMEGLPVVRMVR
jgi:ribosomal protein S18 acetylase RimI-like enzyme